MANFAFIDSQNVHLAVRDQGWRLDWTSFRRYLTDKHEVSKAFIFMGYLSENEPLYAKLRRSGFTIIFKPILKMRKDGKEIIKGNVDAELVLHTMIELQNYERAVIATGDSDFHCLIQYLQQEGKLERLLIPHRKKFGALLREFAEKISYLSDVRHRIEWHPTKRPL